MSDDAIYLGRRDSRAALAGAQRSVLVLGPSRSGKTSSLIVPNVVRSERAVVTTSTKDDVLRQLVHTRADRVTMLFDPSGTIEAPPGVVRVGYSPIHSSREWDRAVLTTRALVDSTRFGRLERGDDHWTERAGALVAPMLHAAALRHETLGALVSRIDGRRGDDHLALLTERYGSDHPASALLAGVLATEERERSSIWSTASGLFQGLRTEAARAASRLPELDIGGFLDGRHHLHVVSPSRHQAVSAPLVVGLIDSIVEATYESHHRGARLLLALDELANVAPLPRLASIVSEGGGQGVTTLACLQDLSQARRRWGELASGFLSLFPTTVVLPGLADRATLELVESLGGRERVAEPSVQRDRRGRLLSHGVTWRERARLDVAAVAHGRAQHAIVLDETKRPTWVELTAAHRDPRWRSYLDRSRDRGRTDDGRSFH